LAVAEPVALLALGVDAAFGWPDRLYRRIGHPVGAFARIILACERRWNDRRASFVQRRAGGIATVVLLLLIVGGGVALVQAAVMWLLGDAAWLLLALLAAPGLAQRSLADHVRPVAAALGDGDLPRAREVVGMIVGRDTAALDEAGTARAAIESLAESFCDGVAAPLFWLLLLGLPGLWAYKAINTADSLIGHVEPRWCAFGWAAARLDDALNLVPARISGALICLCGGGWRTMLADARRHASPNAGWPEAAMAGALGLRLAGPLAYDGLMVDKPWIGQGREAATAADIGRALTLYRRGCLSLWIISGAIAWVL
jgi:adenosylcobinamide-phosphate synthase